VHNIAIEKMENGIIHGTCIRLRRSGRDVLEAVAVVEDDAVPMIVVLFLSNSLILTQPWLRLVLTVLSISLLRWKT